MRESLYDKDFINVLADVAKAGAMQALTQVGKLSPFISKADAYRLYGRKSVDKWIKLGVLTIRGEENEKQRIDRVEIQTIASSGSLANYVNSQEFKNKGIKINLSNAIGSEATKSK